MSEGLAPKKSFLKFKTSHNKPKNDPIIVTKDIIISK